MLSPEELDQLAEDVWELIWDRAEDICAAVRVPDADPEQAMLLAAHTVDAGLAKVSGRVTRQLDEMAQQARLPQWAIGLARGTSRQAVSERRRKAA